MLEKLTITGFKSIKELNDFELKKINVLIGANGAGKSNFIDFFRMLRAMLEFEIPELKEPSLTAFIENKGGMENVLFNGPKITDNIYTELIFNDGLNGYRFGLSLTGAAGILIHNESMGYFKNGLMDWFPHTGNLTRPALIDDHAFRSKYIRNKIELWQIYHFHDTSQFAKVRLPNRAYDNKFLRLDASNLAAFLFTLKMGLYDYPGKAAVIGDGGKIPVITDNPQAREAYENIVETIKIIAPYFEDFILEPYKAGQEEKIKLQWKQKGSSLPMQSYHLSDGTLRFICLATAMLQPQPPELILIDEPELGLHPEALGILAELIKMRKEKTQFILSTQSPTFTDFFEPEDIVTVKRKEGATIFERLDNNSLKDWLEDYSLGDLWRKNVIAGGPVHE